MSTPKSEPAYRPGSFRENGRTGEIGGQKRLRGINRCLYLFRRDIDIQVKLEPYADEPVPPERADVIWLGPAFDRTVSRAAR